jgi:hypothetical protein
MSKQADGLERGALLGTLGDFADAIDGLGELEGEVGLRGWVGGECERDRSDAADESAEQGACVAVGKGAGAVFEQGAEQGEDGGRDFVCGEGGEVDFNLALGGKAGASGTEGARAGLWGVVVAEDVGVDGTAAATFAVGEDMTAFHGYLRKRKSPREAGFFSFSIYKFRISGWESKSANFVGVSRRVRVVLCGGITLVKRVGG